MRIEELVNKTNVYAENQTSLVTKLMMLLCIFSQALWKWCRTKILVDSCLLVCYNKTCKYE